MELLPGGELYDRIIDAVVPMTEKKASKIVHKIIRALIHCHDQNIIHRDLKPENIVFDCEDEPKLVDFGLAIQQNSKEYVWMDSVGSPYYMAPEMLYGKYNKEVDVWSMGVIIYQMLTGEYPFDGFRPNDVADKIRVGSFKIPDSVSDEAYDLLIKMIDFKNEKRITFKECLVHPWFTQASDKIIDPSSILKLKQYKHQSKLKDAAMDQLVKQICPEKTKHLRE